MTVTDLDKQQLVDLVEQQGQRIAALEQQLRRMLHAQFKPTTEKVSADQMKLFEADALDPPKTDAGGRPTETDEDKITITFQRKRRGKRRPCDANLERQRIDYELPESERHCTCCGGSLTKIGEVSSEHYDILPVRYLVIQQVQHKYGCTACKSPAALKTAPKPASILPKTNAGPGLLAQITTAKYVDSVPLHRQEQQHARGGIHLPRNTMARWQMQLGHEVLPLLNLMEDSLRAGSYTQCDETPIQVLKEDGRKASQTSYVWVRYGGPPGREAVLFHYSPSRSSAVVKALFDGCTGYVQCDGYSGYNILENLGLILLGCMAHARRQFMDALKQLSKQEQVHKTKAATAIAYIRALYAIEAEAREQALSPEERYQLRQAKAVPKLEAFKTWLEAQTVLPKSPLGKAIRYTLLQWPKLIRYCEDGRLEIDNNRDERAIRPYAVGRRNWIFADTPRGAHTNARFYSLIETCKIHGHEPYAYLKYVYKELPKATSVEDYEALLPWNLDADTLKQKSRDI